MITTVSEVPIMKETVFGKSNYDNKTEFYLVKINHLKLFPITTKAYIKKGVGAIVDAKLTNSVQKS